MTTQEFEIFAARSRPRLLTTARNILSNVDEAEEWNTDNLHLFNNGYLYIDGTTTASHIEQTSLGIDSTKLTVDCDSLKVFAKGEGLISYIGTASDISINSHGKTTIRTSELIQK